MFEIGEEEIQAVAKVIRSRQLFRYRGGEGGECCRFEEELCNKLGSRHALAVNSGTSALICALVACDIGPADEVIVPAFTFMATAMAVLAAGAVPVIAEIDDSLTLDPHDVQAKISQRTRAVIPVHMSGLPCDMDRLGEIASGRGIRVIEDACQAFGARYRERWLGTIGDAGAFSFNQFKVITSGEGGAVVTNNRAVYEKALIQHDVGCLFRKHADRMSVPLFTGGNYRMSEITGAILREQLKRVDGILERLRARKRAMKEVLAGSSAYVLNPVHCESGDSGLAIMVRLESAQRMRRALGALRSRGLAADSPINSGPHVYAHWEPVLKQRGANHPKMNPFRLTDQEYHYSGDMCPNTLRILGQTVGIPVAPEESLACAQSRAQAVRKVLESV